MNRHLIGLGASIAIGLGTFSTIPAIAHQVEISGEVGGTVHVEPADTPRAGEASLTWFALTRQGGELIPLEDCRCRLAVYAQPRQANSVPIATPSLETVNAEGYTGIPGARITFPTVGLYELVITGEPITPGDFQPFELSFDITVAVGSSRAPAPESLADSPASSPPSPSEPAPEATPEASATANPAAVSPFPDRQGPLGKVRGIVLILGGLTILIWRSKRWRR